MSAAHAEDRSQGTGIGSAPLRTDSIRTVHTDVLVVGAGPTGLACAALLARDGVSVIALTRYPGLANSPRAHIINQRTMEVFRDLGIEERVSEAAMPAGLMGRVVWAESLVGRQIAERRGFGSGPARQTDYAAASPCVPTNIPQHVLEPILSDAAEQLGAEVQFNCELVSMRQEPDRVVSRCRDRVTGEQIEVISKYAVGADGDNSTVVREIGFEVEGVMGLGHMFNYWVKADLSAYTEYRPGALYQVFRPGGQGYVDNAMFVNVRPWDEWVVALPYDPKQGEPGRDAEAATAVTRHYVGDHDLEVELISTSTWTINQVNAETLHRGRVVIAGNAAHRHPPAGGLGVNTCVQDAYNVAWKLSALVRGAADESILESYSAERAPVARHIVDRANLSLDALMAFPRALGLEPGLDEAEWNARLERRFEHTAEGARVREALADAAKLQDYNFNALGVELAHRYDSAGITSDGDPFVPSLDQELFYEFSTAPGSPLPHAWVRRGAELVSTLDLAGSGRLTVLTGIGGDAWRAAAARLAAEFGIEVAVVGIGPGQEVDDATFDWAAVRDIADDGCLLVRPDQHIAYRSRTAHPDAEAQLEAALRRALGRE